MKTKSASAYKWIYAASISAGAIGALPVPGSDIAPLTTLQVSLIVKLSLLYDKPITKDATTKIVVSTIAGGLGQTVFRQDRKSTRLNSSHVAISYAVFCLKKKNIKLA